MSDNAIPAGGYRLTKPVFFIGFMGAGKTSVSQQLAVQYGLASIDADEYLELRDVYKRQIVAYLVMLLVLAACIFLMFSPLFGVGNQFDSLIQSVPTYISQVSEWWNHVYEQYAEFFQDATIKEYMNSAFASLSSWASSVCLLYTSRCV